MQPTTCFHDGVPHPILPETDFVFHDSITFHPTNGIFYPNSDGWGSTIVRFFRWTQFASTRFFLGLENGDTGEDLSLEAHTLIETTTRGQGMPYQLGHGFIMHLPFIGRTQEANVTGLICTVARLVRGCPSMVRSCM
jgi:hypothetical protein